MNVELWLELLVALLLAATVVYSFLLHRRLGTLRGAQEELRQLTGDFSRAMQSAESGLANLKSAGAQAGQHLEQAIKEAEALRDELSMITRSGNDLADRLEKGLVARKRAAEQEDTRGPRPAARSESERELLEALRQAG